MNFHVTILFVFFKKEDTGLPKPMEKKDNKRNISQKFKYILYTI